MQLKHLSVIVYAFLCSHLCIAQCSSVRSDVSAARLTFSDWVINITASLRPGWHVYSQYLGDGGPIPTVITFPPTEDYVPLGKAAELGNPFQFYDSIYEMNIVWFAERVTFAQKVKLNHPVPSLHGTIEYMACNEHTCIPLRTSVHHRPDCQRGRAPLKKLG